MARALARAAGGAIARCDTPQRRQVARHLARALGAPASLRLVRRTYASYAEYWMEALRLPGLTQAQIEAGFQVEGFEHLEAGLAAGHGAVLALPHLGGWEFAGAWFTSQGRGLTVVVEAIEPPEVFAWFRSFRETLGMTVVPLGPGAGSAVMRALRANHVVCLLSDRDLAGDGVPVTFFGEATTLPAGPVTVCLRTGTPLLPAAVYFTPEGGHRCVIRPPLALDRRGSLRDDVARHTQTLALELEVLIRTAPDQWHLMQPNWPSDRV